MMTRSLSLAATAFAALFTVAAGAQAAPTLARVNVPFAFEVGSAHFQPGVYTIVKQSRFMIRVVGPNASALLMTNPEFNRTTLDLGKTVFQHIGDKYFLTQVWSAGASDHAEVVKTNELKKAQRVEEAALGVLPTVKPETISLASLR